MKYRILLLPIFVSLPFWSWFFGQPWGIAHPDQVMTSAALAILTLPIALVRLSELA